jgi:Carboxypeptidase regulatory-like domain
VSNWTDWELIRFQTLVAGRVVDHVDKPVAGAEVSLTARRAENASQSGRRRKRRQKLGSVKDNTVTDADGTFFFVEALEGDYSVDCVSRRSGLRASTEIAVSRTQDEKVEQALRSMDVRDYAEFLRKTKITRQLAVADLKLPKPERK